MKRQFFVEASTFALAMGALILTSCSTPQTRISDRPDLYQSLSHRDQALVSQGQIRIGMSRTAVWLAWGSPDRKIVGDMGGGPTETWLYVYYATYPYYTAYGPWSPRGFHRGPLIRSVLLFIYPAKYPLSQQSGHLRPRQGCVFPVRDVAVS
jgi:hypothetical protein